MMNKTLMVCCGGLPHSIEYMEPTIAEAKTRGYRIVGAYADKEVRKAMDLTGLFDSYEEYSGFWEEGYMVLRIPRADEIFKKVKPDTMLVDLCGAGGSGGVWLEEAHKRNITVVELNGCNCDVLVFNSKVRDLTAQFLESLRKYGYGLEHVEIMADTEGQQWVGLVNGDQLTRDFDSASVKAKLGLKGDQRLVTLLGTWSQSGYQEMCTEDLVEWAKLAKANNAILAFSPHPTMRYAPGLPKVDIPSDVIISSNFPGKFWSYSFILLKTADLIRASDFVIFQHMNGLVRLTLAAKIPTWIRRLDIARGGDRSRIPIKEDRDELLERSNIEDSIGKAFIPSEKFFKQFDASFVGSFCYRTAEQLDALFSGEIKMGRKLEGWDKLDAHLKFRLDGQTAKRIMNLLET